MKLVSCVLLIGSAMAFAQMPPAGAPGQGPQAPTANIKAYLTLTDSQLASLQQIQNQERTALEAIRTEIRTKQTALNTLLASGTNDAARVGAAMIEIQNLRKRIVDQETSFRTQALAVLTQAQRTRLAALDEAAKLRDEIQEAVILNLMAPPAPPAGAAVGAGPRGFEGAGGGPGGGPAGPRGFGFGR